LFACARGLNISDSGCEQIIENRFVNSFKLNFQKVGFAREQIELIKLYMAYGLISGNTKITDRAENALYKIVMKDNFTSSRMQEEYYQYIQVGRYKRYPEKTSSGEIFHLLKKDFPYSNFENYNELIDTVEKRVENICKRKKDWVKQFP
jgi:hypothetical protein